MSSVLSHEEVEVSLMEESNDFVIVEKENPQGSPESAEQSGKGSDSNVKEDTEQVHASKDESEGTGDTNGVTLGNDEAIGEKEMLAPVSSVSIDNSYQNEEDPPDESHDDNVKEDTEQVHASKDESEGTGDTNGVTLGNDEAIGEKEKLAPVSSVSIDNSHQNEEDLTEPPEKGHDDDGLKEASDRVHTPTKKSTILKHAGGDDKLSEKKEEPSLKAENTTNDNCNESGVSEEGDSDQFEFYFSDDEKDETEKNEEEKQAHHVIEVNALSALVEAGQKYIRELVGKEVVLIIGETGVGKSTFVQMLNGAKLKRSESTREINYYAVEDENYLPDFEIGYGERAKTKLIRSYEHSNGLVFCDLPGYKDTDSCHIDIATAVWINDIARVSQSLRLAILIGKNSLYGTRGEGFRDLMALLTKLMKDDPKKFARSMMVFFTHVLDLLPANECDEKNALLSLAEKVKRIRDDTPKDRTDLMNLIRTGIMKENGHVRILNPVTTDADKIAHFFQSKVSPVKSADTFLQCSLPREIALAVQFAMDKLGTSIKEALYSFDLTKQATAYDLVKLLVIFVTMAPTENVDVMLRTTIDSVVTEYKKCKTNVLKVVDATLDYNSTNAGAHVVINNRKVFVVGKEEVEMVIPFFNKLKILSKILAEVDNADDVEVDPNDVDNIRQEYYRKMLLFTIDALGMMESVIDYSPVLQQIDNIKCLEALKSTIGPCAQPGEHFNLPNIFDQFCQVVQSISDEYVLRREHETKCSKSSTGDNKVIPSPMTTSAFLARCKGRLLMHHGSGHYYFLFKKCYDLMGEKLNLNSEDIYEPSNTLTMLESWREDFNSALLKTVSDIAESMDGDSLERLLSLKVANAEKEISQAVLQNAILSKNDISAVLDNVHRVQSFYWNNRHMNIEKHQENDIAEPSPDFLTQLDSEFGASLKIAFADISSGLFKEECTEQFLLFLNKLNLCHFNSFAESVFSKSLETLDNILVSIRSTAVYMMKEIEAISNAAMEQNHFRNLEGILNQLCVGRAQLGNLLTDFDDIQRVHWDIIGALRKSVDDTSTPVISQVCASPVTKANCEDWLKEGGYGADDSIVAELQECLVADGAICRQGYCKFSWSGSLGFLIGSTRLHGCHKVVERALNEKRMECGKKAILVDNDSLLHRLSALSDFIWLDSFELNTSESAPTVTQMLQIIMDGIQWRFSTLRSSLAAALTSEEVSHKKAADICQECKQLLALSNVLALELDVSSFLSPLKNRVQSDCTEIKKASFDLSGLDVESFPFESFQRFLELKKIFEYVDTNIQKADSELSALVLSAENSIDDGLQRLIVSPLMLDKNVLNIEAKFLSAVFAWEDEMLRRAPALSTFVSVLNNFSVRDGTEYSLRHTSKKALNVLMASIEQLISEGVDIEGIAENITLLGSFSPLGDYLDLPLSSRHSFFYSQLLTKQSHLQEEFKENISKFEFTNMREYLDKWNDSENAAAYKRYDQLMEVIEGVLRQFLRDLQQSIKDGAAMKDGLTKLRKAWEELGGFNERHDHVNGRCQIDLEKEMSDLNKRCCAHLDSLLARTENYKGNDLEVAVKAAEAAWIYNKQLEFSQYENSISEVLNKLRKYLCWDGFDKVEDDTLAHQVISLAQDMCYQNTRDVSDGALSPGALANVLDQLKVMEGCVVAPPIQEMLDYSFWVRKITNICRDFFGHIASNAEKDGSLSTALKTLKLVASSFSESLSRHLNENELQLSSRIANLENQLDNYNKTKYSAFETKEGCLNLKEKLNNLMESTQSTSYLIPKAYESYYNKCFFEPLKPRFSRKYKERAAHYQSLVDQLHHNLKQALNDNNFDLVSRKFKALELVEELLYEHLRSKLGDADKLITSHLKEMLEGLIKALDAKDLTIFKQRFESFYFYRKLLKESLIPIDEDSFIRIKDMHNGLATILNSSKDQFENMCSQLNFDNALNIIDSVKASRSIIDSQQTNDYIKTFGKVQYMISARILQHGRYERATKVAKDESLKEFDNAASNYPQFSQISSAVQKLHSTILDTVKESVANHEYFKLKSISEGLRSFHLLSDLGGGSDLIENTKKSVNSAIKGGLDALRQDVTKHWTNKAWAQLNDSIKVLLEAENELKHFSGLIDTSLMYTIHQELEKKLTDIGDQAVKIASSTTGDRTERIRDFAIKLADLGRVYDQVQEFHAVAKTHINRVLNHCREKCGLHFIFRLGVILEEGTVFGEDANAVRIGRRLVSDFNHFKDVATMAWNKRVSQIPVEDSLKNMQCFTYNAKSKQKKTYTFDSSILKTAYDRYKDKYDKLVLQYIPTEKDEKEIVTEVLQLAASMKSCSLNSWDDLVKQEIPHILAGIFAFYTISKCGDSFNSIGSEENGGETSSVNAQDILVTPHNIQVLTILRLLGCGDSSKTSLQNHMMQIGTGEGKSIVLGALATIFGILNFSVRCVCYSEYLSSRDYDDFREIFTAFKCQKHIVYSKITSFSEDSVSKKGDIRRLTREMILGKKKGKGGSGKKGNIHDEEEEMPTGQSSKPSRGEVLLVDEVDVFFGKDFYGHTYNQVTHISTSEVTALIKKIWKERSSKPSLRGLSSSSEYKKLISDFPQWKFLIDNELRLMCAQVNHFNQPAYFYDSQRDQVGYSDHDTISYALTYGYRTLFAHLNELDKGEVKAAHTKGFDDRHLQMQVSCGQFSYANINPSCILGVSGTLQALTDYEREVMTRYNIGLYSIAPSVYGTKQLIFDAPDTGLHVAANKSDYFKAIVDTINDMSRSKDATRKKHRAVIVFFESNRRMQEFRKSEFFRQVVENTSVNMLSEDTPKDSRDYIIKKAATAGQVTLSTKAFGRGTDFISRDTELNDRGGTHIVQTFLSEMLSEEIQIQGRTSRQGQKGSYSLILLAEDDLEEPLGTKKNQKKLIARMDSLQHFGVLPSEMSSQSRAERYKYLSRKRDKKRETESVQIEENLAVASKRDAQTREYFTALLTGKIDKAMKLFEEIYMDFKGVSGQQQQVGIHVIFMLDESSSMGGIKYDELRQAYNDFINQRLNKDGTDNDVLTVITFSSTANTVCTMVPFSSAPSLPFKGGGTSFYPPLTNAEDALVQAGSSDLMPILVLMTDGCCSDVNQATSKMTDLNSNYKDDGLQVHFVAFGSGASISNLETLKEACDEGHIHTAALGDLTATFKEIEESIVVAEYNCS